MIYSVLRRRLREGVTFQQFKEAWVPGRSTDSVRFTVTHCRSLSDPREILSIGAHDMSAEEFEAFAASEDFARINSERHGRLAPLVEEGGFIGAYEVLEADGISL